MSRDLGWCVGTGGALIAALAAAWLAAAGWLEPTHLRFWAAVTMAGGVPGFALDELVLAYPHLWLLTALVAAFAGETLAATGLAALAAASVGIATALWYGLFRRHGWSTGWGVLLTGLCLVHPYALWIVTRGGMDSVALVGVSLLLVVVARLARGFEPRHVVILALVLGSGLLLDPRWVFLAVVVVPFLPFLLGRRWLDEAAPGLLIVALVPMLGALLFLATVGWIFGGRPLAFLAEAGWRLAPSAALAGATEAEGATTLWLLVATLAGTPLLGLVLWRSRGRRRAVLLLVGSLPVAGLVAATGLGAGWHGLDFLHVALVTGVLAIAQARRLASPPVVVGLVVAGHLGGWLAMADAGSQHVATWQAALARTGPAAELFAAERALAGFLVGGPATLLDDRAGFPVVVALGVGQPLVLPPSPAFAGQLLRPLPTIEQIALPAPAVALAVGDRIARRYPELWATGLPGYRLVYDDARWRVWRRLAADDDTGRVRCLGAGSGGSGEADGLRASSCPRLEPF